VPAEPAESEQRGGASDARTRLGNELELQLGEPRDTLDQPVVTDVDE